MDDATNAWPFGLGSLWCGVAGLTLPLLLAFWLEFVSQAKILDFAIQRGLAGCLVILFAALEVVALVTGLVNRRALFGKVGICLAAMSFSAVAGGVITHLIVGALT